MSVDGALVERGVGGHPLQAHATTESRSRGPGRRPYDPGASAPRQDPRAQVGQALLHGRLEALLDPGDQEARPQVPAEIAAGGPAHPRLDAVGLEAEARLPGLVVEIEL